MVHCTIPTPVKSVFLALIHLQRLGSSTLPMRGPLSSPSIDQDLETLNASKNLLGTLPQNFTFLTSLTDLDLSCNRFKDVPMLLCGMGTLRRLDLTSNIICSLPREVGKLTTLAKLHLRHNLIK